MAVARHPKERYPLQRHPKKRGPAQHRAATRRRHLPSRRRRRKQAAARQRPHTAATGSAGALRRRPERRVIQGRGIQRSGPPGIGLRVGVPGAHGGAASSSALQRNTASSSGRATHAGCGRNGERELAGGRSPCPPPPHPAGGRGGSRHGAIQRDVGEGRAAISRVAAGAVTPGQYPGPVPRPLPDGDAGGGAGASGRDSADGTAAIPGGTVPDPESAAG